MIKKFRLFKLLSVLAILMFALSGCNNSASVTADSTTLASSSVQSRQVAGVENTFAVMAPLHVENWGWGDFENQLATVKGYGVQAVSVDVWWGDVEGSGDDNYDWSYYDTIFGKIRNAGMNVVPIMSFHQCGGNVGDDYTSNLPPWIWGHYNGVSSEDLRYEGEEGTFSSEYVSLWADSLVMDEYVDFMDSFENHFAYMASDIDEINISGGSAGELRYPSYNKHDFGGYPNRGSLQAYGQFAVDDFRNDMITKYGSISGVNSAWGTSLSSSYDINPPGQPNAFFNNWDYKNTQYGLDFMDWYNQSLKEHGKRMINAAKDAFDNQFANIDLGMKIPGVHWQISNPNNPRLAELTAGLIKASDDYQSASTGHGYGNIVNTFVDNNRQVNMHFTCLEMGNDEGNAYSKAQDLVFWVAQAAADQGVRIKGENALFGGVISDYGWDHIDNAFAYASFTGLTVLRMNDVASGTGAYRYAQLINAYSNTIPSGWDTAYFRGTANSWDTTLMSKNSAGLWETTQDFGSDNPRFKITHNDDWAEAYPATDYLITGGAGTYTITFDENSKAVVATKIESVNPGPTPVGDLVIHFREWESATTYSVHPWNGLSGDVAMDFEGSFNGGYWWKVTISNAPADFMLCFNNSNGNWDGVDRHYTDQGSDIYVVKGDSSIYTTRQ